MTFDVNDPTVDMQAMCAVLAHLGAASAAVTYSDLPWDVFRAIERCREDVAALLGVDVETYVQRRGESDEDYARRMQGWGP